MKKYIYLLIALVLTASCSLEEKPRGSVDSNSVISSVSSAGYITNNLYVRMRSLTSGSPIYVPELMADCFNATLDFGNRGVTYYKWQWTAEDSFMESLWGSCYSATYEANKVLDGISKLSRSGLTEAETDSLTYYQGVCYFTKAYTAFILTQKYCKVYNASTASSDYGVMLVDDCNSTPSDWSTYPGRSTLKETYDFIESNLSKAASAVAVGGKNRVGASTITTDVVTAMQARVALYKGDYATAASLSSSLVDSGRYPLVESWSEMYNMWKNDSGKECIMQMYANYESPASLPSSNSYNFLGDNVVSNAYTYSPDYFPSRTATAALGCWGSTLDFRTIICFGSETTDDKALAEDFSNLDAVGKGYKITFATVSGHMFLFDKFCGNSTLQAPNTSGKLIASTHVNKIKPFRIAEQYLIAAEAYAMEGNSVSALKYINALLKHRIVGFTDYSLTGDNLIALIRQERMKELLGEGFRFDDLKRWGNGMARVKNYNSLDGSSTVASMMYLPGDITSELLSTDASNFRWQWPIPQAELDANPQIKNQQNEGY